MDEVAALSAFWLPALAETALRGRFTAAVLERGRGLAVGPCQSSSEGAQQQVQARVAGSRPYRSSLRLAPGSLLRGDCDCPQGELGIACKHQAALALAWRRELSGGGARAVDSEDAARVAVAALFDARSAEASAAQLSSLLPLLQGWRSQQPLWAQAGAEQALLLLAARLAALQAERGWAEGEAEWQALSAAVVAELFAAWTQIGAQAAAYAERYLALLQGAPGQVDAARALPLLGDAVAGRAGDLLRQDWQRGGDAQVYLAHLAACGVQADRLEVLAASRADAAGHAAYIAALLAAGRGREALGAAEAAYRAWPGDRALEAQLLALYEQDGWDAEALALRRAAFAREPSAAAHAELLRAAPDAEAEAQRLQEQLGGSNSGRRLRLQLWAAQARWDEGLAWLRGRPPLEAGLLDAAGAWLMQLPPEHDAEAAELLKDLLQASLRQARPPFERELHWVQEICRRLPPTAAQLWLAWLRVEQRKRRDFLALLP